MATAPLLDPAGTLGWFSIARINGGTQTNGARYEPARHLAGGGLCPASIM
jgi:hypothetical protein